MNAETVAGYRTAGHTIVDWFINLIVTYGLIPVIAVGAVAIVALLCGIGAACHLAGRMRDRHTERRDRAAAWRMQCCDPPAEQPQPGTDIGLYLDCVAIYADCNELDRLRDAIDQQRKEKPQP